MESTVHRDYPYSYLEHLDPEENCCLNFRSPSHLLSLEEDERGFMEAHGICEKGEGVDMIQELKLYSTGGTDGHRVHRVTVICPTRVSDCQSFFLFN